MIQRVITFIQEARHELRRVNWPNRQETIRLTVVVIALSLATALFLGVFDFVFLYGLNFYLGYFGG